MQRVLKICSHVVLAPVHLAEAALEFVFGTPPIEERETWEKAQDDNERMQKQLDASKETLNPPSP
jgi:hypothetical protein